jgi:uncharacterized protein YacL
MSVRSGRVAGAVLRILVAILAAAIGADTAPRAGYSPVTGVVVTLVLTALAVVVERAARRARLERLAWGTLGTVVGVLAGIAAGFALASVAPAVGTGAVALGALLGAWLGGATGVRRGGEVTGLNAWLFPRVADGRPTKLVDTSSLIDGRIADLATTGFIDGPLVIPEFVLREMQQIADASDPRKRTRGKRGFDVVQRLQRLPGLAVEVDPADVPGVTEVDEKLLALARARGAKIVTTDYNLNKRAELTGVVVLNVNDLANALKPAAVAGEAMRVHVLREGKESGQGVAYLDDGTMVVVDQGKRWIGQTVDVAVTSVLQTSAGRIIFTRLRDDEPGRA